MKYIITESQYNLLNESVPSWIRRRVNKESLKDYISAGEMNFPTLCDDFIDEYRYADSVIKWAVDDFLISGNDDYEYSDDYDEIHDTIVTMCVEWFGEYLFKIYRETCSEENGY